ncbi:MAG: hypothetical protein AAGI38_09735 [Bacteroidota bacterium]
MQVVIVQDFLEKLYAAGVILRNAEHDYKELSRDYPFIQSRQLAHFRKLAHLAIEKINKSLREEKKIDWYAFEQKEVTPVYEFAERISEIGTSSYIGDPYTQKGYQLDRVLNLDVLFPTDSINMSMLQYSRVLRTQALIATSKHKLHQVKTRIDLPMRKVSA